MRRCLFDLAPIYGGCGGKSILSCDSAHDNWAKNGQICDKYRLSQVIVLVSPVIVRVSICVPSAAYVIVSLYSGGGWRWFTALFGAVIAISCDKYTNSDDISLHCARKNHGRIADDHK